MKNDALAKTNWLLPTENGLPAATALKNFKSSSQWCCQPKILSFDNHQTPKKG
jgi:hypothetical protein